MNIFDVILIKPIVTIIVAFYQLLTAVHIPYALGFAIILMTVAIRLLMYPLITKQLELSKKMQEIAPHLSHIKEKHKGDARKIQEATMALYREHNLNPVGGCLPGLVQIVVLIFGLYPAVQHVLTAKDIVGTVNNLLYFPGLKLTHPWDTNFFGFALGKTPGELFGSLGLIVLLVPILTAVFQFAQSKMMMPKKDPTALALKDAKKEEDFATAFQRQSLYLLPIMIGVFSWNFAIGLSLYWNTFTIFGIIQQYRVAGLGAAQEWVDRFKKKK